MELCNQLNYVRSLSPGKAHFYHIKDGIQRPISVDKTRLRAPKAGYSEGFLDNHLKQKELAPQDLAYANPQYIEECYAPSGVNTVYCEFSLRINAYSLKPDVCMLAQTRETLVALAAQYKVLGGYQEIARRVAKNIFMGTWLWRNRACRSLSIQVKTSDYQIIDVEKAFGLTWQGRWPQEAEESLEVLTAFLTKALSDPTDLYYLDVVAKLSVGQGEQLYPSQEYIEGKQEGVPSKQLAKAYINGTEETVAFHSQKVGAALQSIDDWWDIDADKPLRVHEYGADREYVIARRHPQTDKSFYQLVCKAEEYLAVMTEQNVIPDDVHFIMAVLVKANVFNNLTTTKKKKPKA